MENAIIVARRLKSRRIVPPRRRLNNLPVGERSLVEERAEKGEIKTGKEDGRHSVPTLV